MPNDRKRRPRVVGRTLRGSGRPLSELAKAQRDQEKVPSSGITQMTAIERARLERKQ